MIEVCKIIDGYTPPIMDNFFISKENAHNLRHFQIILNKNKKNPVRYGSETIFYITPLLWVNLPEEHKLENYLSELKPRIKSWKCDACVCRLC